ncbi:MAG: TetR/AcrR family transcriptional regulator [Myxococcales bacterium]|nr:TetR/AcrR family transcriptional regulator [Myxococcales bacterium]
MLDEGLDVGLRAVARRAGVSPAAPYRHFADKEALLSAAALEGFDALRAALVAVDEGAPIERVRALGVAYVVFAAEHPGWFRLMFSDQLERARHPALVRASRPPFSLLAAAIREAVARGQLRGDPRDLTRMAWSLVHGVAHLVLGGQGRGAGIDEEDVAGTAARVIDTALVGATRA